MHTMNGSLLDLAEHRRAAVGCGSKFKNPDEELTE
jgi:hypothetical protein